MNRLLLTIASCSIALVEQATANIWQAVFPATGAAGEVLAAVEFDDRLYFGGSIGSVANHVVDNVVVFDPTDNSWEAMPPFPGTDQRVWDLVVYDDGSGPALYAAGDGVYRWSGNSWETLGVIENAILDLEVADLGNGPSLVASGAFFSPSNPMIRGVAQWDGAEWQPIGENIIVTVGVRMAKWNDQGTEKLALAGFIFLPDSTSTLLIIWDGTQWTVPGEWATDAEIFDIKAYDEGSGEALFVCGSFNEVSNVTTGGLARWNGNAWSALSNSTTIDACRSVSTINRDSNSKLVFYNDGLSTWDSSNLSALAVPFSSPVKKWVLLNDGRSVAIGLFEGQPDTRIWIHDNTDWTSPELSNNSKPAWEIDRVEQIRSHHDEVFAAGQFDNLGTNQSYDLAKWDGTQMIGLAHIEEQFSVSPREFAIRDNDGPEIAFLAGDQLGIWTKNNIEIYPAPKDIFRIAYYDEGNGEEIFIAGQFFDYQGTSLNQVARFDNGSFAAVAAGLELGNVGSLVAINSGPTTGLYVLVYRFSGATVHHWNGLVWEPLPSVGNGHFWSLFAIKHDGQEKLMAQVGDSLYLYDGASWDFLATSLGIVAGGSNVEIGSRSCLYLATAGSPGAISYYCGNGMQTVPGSFHSFTPFDPYNQTVTIGGFTSLTSIRLPSGQSRVYLAEPHIRMSQLGSKNFIELNVELIMRDSYE